VLEAVGRILVPEPIDNSVAALAVMFVAILSTIVLVVYQRRVVNRTGSLAVEADRSHYSSDLITNLGVVLALVLTTWMGWPLADPLIAIAVSVVMLFTAWGVGRQSLDQLMDRQLPQADLDRIRTIVRGHGAVRSLHDLKTRQAGLSTFIQLHLEMDPAMTLADAHIVSDEVEKDLMAAFPGAEVIIHQDPAGLEEIPPGG
jgi:ferrous-iron efflux pump FieF